MARIFRNRAKPSTTKLPSKVTSLPSGSNSTITPAATSRTIEAESINTTLRSARKTPSINSAMAPRPSTISGSSGTRLVMVRAVYIAYLASPADCTPLTACWKLSMSCVTDVADISSTGFG